MGDLNLETTRKSIHKGGVRLLRAVAMLTKVGDTSSARHIGSRSGGVALSFG